ncbi:MAG TPA: MaoC family dehydratase [Ktedonobacterales bacterium]
MTPSHDHSISMPQPIPDLGTRATITRTITDDDVRHFARLTGDTNPVHLDSDYAATTRFGEPIVHGILTAGLISAVIGTQLPGLGAIYLKQALKFVAPVRHGDTITASAEVVDIRPDKRILTLRTECTNQHGECVIEGEAIVMC